MRTRKTTAIIYEWLDWLEPRLPFPVYRVTARALRRGLAAQSDEDREQLPAALRPLYIVDEAGKTGFLMRQCTTSFKIEPIQRKMRELRDKRPVSQWIGISTDEAHRMKPARVAWLTNRWPLIEAGMRRSDCLRWMADHGYPKPPRSACVFCPYHSNEEGRRYRGKEPESFAAAVKRDLQTTSGRLAGFVARRTCRDLNR